MGTQKTGECDGSVQMYVDMDCGEGSARGGD
jgi:hypothetical protein